MLPWRWPARYVDAMIGLHPGTLAEYRAISGRGNVELAVHGTYDGSGTFGSLGIWVRLDGHAVIGTCCADYERGVVWRP